MNTIMLSMLLMFFSPTSDSTYKTVLRDEIAMEYMEKINFKGKRRFYGQIARDAYRFAEAMMNERENYTNDNN